MVWHKISSGRIYNSSSGHALIICGISKCIIGVVLYSNTFCKFYAIDKKVEESEEHEFPKCFEGNSKIMEAYAILKMAEDALLH